MKSIRSSKTPLTLTPVTAFVVTTVATAYASLAYNNTIAAIPMPGRSGRGVVDAFSPPLPVPPYSYSYSSSGLLSRPRPPSGSIAPTSKRKARRKSLCPSAASSDNENNSQDGSNEGVQTTKTMTKTKTTTIANNNNNNNNNLRQGSIRAATAQLGKVPYGEQSRKYRRTIFTHRDWVDHRSSSSRIFDNLQSMFFSGVVRQLRPQVTAVTAVAALVTFWNVGILGTAISHPEIFADYELMEYFPTLHAIALPTVPFTLSSPALGLLLVFRTNASYARWMEGRNSWARMISHGKNLVRMASVFSTEEAAVRQFSKAVWLYLRTVMNRLSSPEEDEEVYIREVNEVFGNSDSSSKIYENNNENREGNDTNKTTKSNHVKHANRTPSNTIAKRIISSSDRTNTALKYLSQQLHSLPAADPKALIETDKSIIILTECTTICEKIYSSPVPLVYTRHTARFLSLWALLLPCALYSAFSSAGQEWAVLPASSVLSFFLFGVDELAMQLEEPFSILPMKAFCEDVRRSGEILSMSWNDDDETQEV